jgi:hypothetical protein
VIDITVPRSVNGAEGRAPVVLSGGARYHELHGKLIADETSSVVWNLP